MPELNFDIEHLTTAQLNLLMAGAMAVGTLYCFLGYRTLRFIIALTGFGLAGAVAGAIALWLTKGNETAGLIALVVGGISGAYALFFLYKAGIFLVGSLGSGLIANVVLENTGESWTPLVVLGVAVVGGLIALILEKPVMLVATAALGAWMIVAGTTYFVLGGEDIARIGQALNSQDERFIVLGSWALLSVAGGLSQFAVTRGGPGPAPAPAPNG